MSPFLSSTNLCFRVNDEIVPSFFRLLQHGFMVKAQVGCSIKAFLCQQLGLSPEYVDKSIQTIFMDGRPVDDIDSAMVEDGSTLALSAAMPGLAGATLRKGGYYAPMRSQISYREATTSRALQEGMILVKLFNLVLSDVGPTLLKQGIWIKGEDLSDFLGRQPDDFWTGCQRAQVDGKDLNGAELLEMKWNDQEIFLQVRAI